MGLNGHSWQTTQYNEQYDPKTAFLIPCVTPSAHAEVDRQPGKAFGVLHRGQAIATRIQNAVSSSLV